MTVATWLTIGRIVLILPFAAALLAGLPWIAAIVFALAGLTDWFDGWVARKRGEVSALGATLDPVADKMLTAAALILFAATGAIAGWHLVAALVIALREALIGGLREATASDGIKLPVTPLAKWKTTAQFAAFLFLCFGPNVVGLVLLWLAAALTAVTGYQYTAKAVSALSLPSE
ncbi:CDP-diacylglycerol--glycerol-3-phosphate 3-phosphatidyltransferase [Parvularcula dongshanensis]|uniref:CDP-diacylglycerol--glycerol-3-phosphate 3-phosphatidyltransferase n=1 Tax=Parvularcula dongshanensis TaxID=1173995 RepID=A0A840I6H2_9PROT|nr:cardiolipin synthase [Parvularcula dongshanensis]